MFSIKLIIIWAILVAIKPTRKLALALTPWLVFACSYDGMRASAQLRSKPHRHTRHLRSREVALRHHDSHLSTLIPGEWFNLHNCASPTSWLASSICAGSPVPLGFAIYLYLKGKREMYLRFSLAFLFVNLVGFVGYYIHPAAPPWYVLEHGFTPVLNTPGSVAGLGRFDTLVGAPVFHSIYCNNSNVFAAVPSLHAAYMLVATIYAIISRQHKLCIGIFAFICMGIWWTAVYSTHHYIIDVLLGILTTIVTLLILERLLLRTEWAKHFMAQYAKNI